jgi:hypothetical protein
MLAWFESGPVTLNSPITVRGFANQSKVGVGEGAAESQTAVIASGTRLCSAFVYGHRQTSGSLQSSITLPGTVLGVAIRTAELAETQSFEADGIDYEISEIDMVSDDWVERVSARVLTINMAFTVSASADGVRILYSC